MRHDMPDATPSPLTLLFVTPECTPFAQAGGLGDVSAALPGALCARGHHPIVVMPAYPSIDRQTFTETSVVLRVPVGDSLMEGRVWRGSLRGGVPLYAIDQPAYFDRPGIYGPNGADYPDNLERFSFLSRAALALSSALGLNPDVLHAHDWPTALSVLYAHDEAVTARRGGLPTVLSIHNVGYQGVFPVQGVRLIGIDPRELRHDSLEHYGRMNLLKGGIHNATMLTTVSPTYAREIQDPRFGCGLDGVLRSRARDLHGILNGVDTGVWNPSTDPHLPAHFDRDDLTGKAVCKAELQRQAGLPVRPDVPVIGLISRLTHQKGLDVLARAMRRILALDLQMVLLGTGDEDAEAFFEMATRVRPDRFRAWIDFDVALAHRIEAGSDFFLMPSRYEPCGLNQMYSLCYGTLPIVRATGGLDDSVESYEEATGLGTGFKLHDLNPSSLFDVVGWAVSTWYDRPHHIAMMRRRAMARDFSWAVAAEQYEGVYRLAIERHASQEPLAPTG